MQVTFMSKSLMRNVPMQVLLPVDKLPMPGQPEYDGKPLKTLYLLHGIFGSCTSWLAESRIKRWAEKKNLAVVMPSGDNGFYVDQPLSYNLHGEFVGKELVEMSRKMFPLSHKREDTFIAGLSMGGFGALRNGLKYHDTFSHIAAFSSALVLEQAVDLTYEEPHITGNRGYFESCFGNIDDTLKSDKNPKELIRMLKERKARNPDTRIPKIYLACGTEDPLIKNNRDFRDFLKKEAIPCTYVEGPGIHDWEFWDTYIKKALDWLPLNDATAGVDDGNVGA
ncbi:MAG: alpha/beta hydrolase family protein [Treponemataceae bacterium]